MFTVDCSYKINLCITAVSFYEIFLEVYSRTAKRENKIYAH